MKTRKMSIRAKLMLGISVMSILCCLVIGIVTYMKVSNMLIDESKEGAMGLAAIAAGEIDGERFVSIQSEEDEEFKEVYHILAKYRESDTLQYIYSMRMSGDTLEFVVDTDLDEPTEVGEEYELLDDMLPAFNGEVCCDKEVSSDEWGSYFSAYAPIFDEEGSVRGIVGCDIGIDSINAKLGNLRMILIVIVVISCIVCVIVAVLISNSISKNMRVLHGKIVELNSGNGDLTHKLDITSGDEIEEIANTFNTFIEQIHHLVKGIANTTHILKKSSEHVDSMAEESNSHLEKMTESLENLSAGMEETSAGTNIIADSLDDTVKEISVLNDKAVSSSDKALQISNNAYKVKEKIKATNDNTKRVVEKFRDDIEILRERCSEIDKIDEIIDEILKVAHSTKILAQNTNIEAARAGEYGRGFGVIAGNISKLNDQISDLVKRIRESNNSVKDTVSQLMDNSGRMSDYLGKNIIQDYSEFVTIGEEYSDNMAKVAELFGRFSDITRAANENIITIGKSVSEIDSVINDATVNIADVHSSGINLKEEINTLVAIADDNVKESEHMANEVGKFQY